MDASVKRSDLISIQIEPWYEKKNRYTNPRLRKDTPQEILDLYEEWKRLVREEVKSDDVIDW